MTSKVTKGQVGLCTIIMYNSLICFVIPSPPNFCLLMPELLSHSHLLLRWSELVFQGPVQSGFFCLIWKDCNCNQLRKFPNKEKLDRTGLDQSKSVRLLGLFQLQLDASWTSCDRKQAQEHPIWFRTEGDMVKTSKSILSEAPLYLI